MTSERQDEAPRCPLCGAGMQLRETDDGLITWRCPSEIGIRERADAEKKMTYREG